MNGCVLGCRFRMFLNLYHSLIALFDRQPQPLTHKRITVARRAVNLSLLYPFKGLYALISLSVMN